MHKLRFIIKKSHTSSKLSSLFTPEKLSEVLIQVDEKNNEIGPIPILDAHLTSNVFKKNLLKNSKVFLA